MGPLDEPNEPALPGEVSGGGIWYAMLRMDQAVMAPRGCGFVGSGGSVLRTGSPLVRVYFDLRRPKPVLCVRVEGHYGLGGPFPPRPAVAIPR
jgi:hypothetical protein